MTLENSESAGSCCLQNQASQIISVEFRYYCDGGFQTKRNVKNPAYGSYLSQEVTFYKGYTKPIIKTSRQITFDYSSDINTNNKAEYLTFVHCLEAILVNQSQNDIVNVMMDSQIVLHTVQDIMILKSQELEYYKKLAKSVMKDINSKEIKLSLNWISGKEMKTILGH